MKNTFPEESICAPVCRVGDVILNEQSARGERSELSVPGRVCLPPGTTRSQKLWAPGRLGGSCWAAPPWRAPCVSVRPPAGILSVLSSLVSRGVRA